MGHEHGDSELGQSSIRKHKCPHGVKNMGTVVFSALKCMVPVTMSGIACNVLKPFCEKRPGAPTDTSAMLNRTKWPPKPTGVSQQLDECVGSDGPNVNAQLWDLCMDFRGAMSRVRFLCHLLLATIL